MTAAICIRGLSPGQQAARSPEDHFHVLFAPGSEPEHNSNRGTAIPVAPILIFSREPSQETAQSQSACQVRFHCLDCRWCFCLRKHSSDQEKKLTHSGRAPSSGNRQGINQGTRTRNMAFQFGSQGIGLRRKEILE